MLQKIQIKKISYNFFQLQLYTQNTFKLLKIKKLFRFSCIFKSYEHGFGADTFSYFDLSTLFFVNTANSK